MIKFSDPRVQDCFFNLKKTELKKKKEEMEASDEELMEYTSEESDSVYYEEDEYPERWDVLRLTLPMVRAHYKKHGTRKPIRYFSTQIYSELNHETHNDDDFRGEWTPDGTLVEIRSPPAWPGATCTTLHNATEIETPGWLAIDGLRVPVSRTDSMVSTFCLRGIVKPDFDDAKAELSNVLLYDCNAVGDNNYMFFYVKKNEWHNKEPLY